MYKIKQKKNNEEERCKLSASQCQNNNLVPTANTVVVILYKLSSSTIIDLSIFFSPFYTHTHTHTLFRNRELV